uniref:Uncharacterized protein n=1 Tax=Rhizophora mucronata TaxID=61149 RepID=A0A2P2QD23_RHIMU
MTSVLGSVDKEKMVMAHSKLPFLAILVHIPSATSMMIFCRLSAAMNFKFMA